MRYEDEGDDMGALQTEREEADQQQHELEAAGRAMSKGVRRMESLRAAGKLAEAAAACPHGCGYPLASLAAKYANDPRAGEAGVRCGDCGSVIDGFPFGGHRVAVLHPCEVTA